MPRIAIAETIDKINHAVKINGWISSRRDMGKIIFLDVRDGSGIIQVVASAQLLQDAREEWVIEVEGKVRQRPPKLFNSEIATGQIEIQAEKITILAPSEILPFVIKDKEFNVSLPVLFDFRPLSLRNQKVKAIFKVQEAVIEGFRKTLKNFGFTEFQSPAIVPNAPEGGSEVFHVDYYDYDAYLAQSPQLYKQIMVGVFEKVFTVCKAYRAEKSVTTRHLSEYVSLDAEFGFIESYEDLMDVCEKTIKGMIQSARENCPMEFKLHNAREVDLNVKIPRMKLRDAQALINCDLKEPDLSPDDERKICEYAKQKLNSDFIFITHFPTKKRPFYTYPDPDDPEYTQSFDLLFRGMEIITGSRRINDYRKLLDNIREFGNSESNFSFYLQAFKYGMPPEGGFAIGLERVVKQLLGLQNVSEASLFPRDTERIDVSLSSVQERKTKKSAKKS